MVNKYLMNGCQGKASSVRGGVNFIEQFFEKFTRKPPFLTLSKKASVSKNKKKAIYKLSSRRKNITCQ